MSITQSLPATNDEGFDLIAQHLSPHKAAAYRALGIDIVQGRREGVRVWAGSGRPRAASRTSRKR